MKQTKTKNILENIKTGFLYKTLSIGIPFIIRTTMINYLGIQIVGLNNLFISILQLINLLEMGFSSAVTFKLYQPLVNNDFTKVRSVMNYFKKVYLLIGVSVVIGGLLILPFLRFFIDQESLKYIDVNIHLIFLLFLFNSVIGYFSFSYRAILLLAIQKLNTHNLINIFVLLIRSILQLISIIIFSNFYFFLISLIFSNLVGNLLLYYITHKKYKNFFGSEKLDDYEKKQIAEKVKGLLIGKFSNISRNSFDSIVISSYLGVYMLGLYSNYYYILSSVLYIYTIFTDSISAAVGDSVARLTSEENYKYFKRIYFAFNWFGTVLAVILIVLYQPFITLWLGTEYLLSEITMFLFVTYFYILQLGQIRSIYSKAKGTWDKTKKISLIESIMNVSLNFILGYFFGINGVLMATIFTVFIFSIYGVGKKTINLTFNSSSRLFVLTTIKYFTNYLLLASLMYYLFRYKLFDNMFLDFFVKSLFSFALSNILMLVLIKFDKYSNIYLRDITVFIKEKRF